MALTWIHSRSSLRRQEHVHLPGRFQRAIELVESQQRPARRFDHAGEDRAARQQAVAIERAVPLDAAGEPGVADGEIGELQDRVVEEQFAPPLLVVEGDHPSAERRVEGRPEGRVFDLDGRQASALRAAACSCPA